MKNEVQYLKQIPTHHPVYGTDAELVFCTLNSTLYKWNRDTKTWDTVALLTDIPETTGGSDAYLEYTVLLNQDGTGAPVATELVNTLDVGLTWAREIQGVYTLTADSAIFSATKTFLNYNSLLPPTGDFPDGVIVIFSSTTVLQFRTFAGLVWDFPQDDILTNVPFQIRIYP